MRATAGKIFLRSGIWGRLRGRKLRPGGQSFAHMGSHFADNRVAVRVKKLVSAEVSAVSNCSASGLGSEAEQGGKFVGGDFGVGIGEETVEGLATESTDMLGALPLLLAKDLPAKRPEFLVFDDGLFDCAKGGIGEVLTPGGGAFGPVVAGTEIAYGFVCAAGFFSDIDEAGFRA